VCLQGKSGAYVSTADVTDVRVPATLQTTIAARIDRLNPEAKRTLGAAAVIGSRFGLDLLSALGAQPAVADLVAGQLIDQVTFHQPIRICLSSSAHPGGGLRVSTQIGSGRTAPGGWRQRSKSMGRRTRMPR